MDNKNNNKRKIFDGKYEIYGIVGKGQSSVVYHAKLIDKDLDVAIKVLVNGNGADYRELLRKESLSLVSCRHDNVVKLEDFQVLDKLCYLVMEYAKYNDITKFLNGEVLDYKKGEKFLIQILQGLDFIHKIGFVHRDICPENILVFDNDIVKLGDFGLGELAGDGDKNHLKVGITKKDFIAPEYFNGGEVSAISDIYSLGATFFYLFTHSKSLNVDLIKNKKLAYCLKKMIMPSPKDRFKSAFEVLDFLNARNPMMSLEDSRRLTKDHLEDIAILENEFDKVESEFQTKGHDSYKIYGIKKQKDDFCANGLDKNTDNENNQRKKDVSKMTLKEINKSKLEELERKENIANSSAKKEPETKDLCIKEKSSSQKNKNCNVYQLKKKGKGKKLFLLLLLIGAILFLLSSFGIFKKNITNDTNKNSLNQKNTDVKLTFPNLQNGIYEGELQHIIFNKVPFEISVKDNITIFTIKSEGFSPVMFDNSKNIDEMEVRFNGVILVLKAIPSSKNILKGNVINKVTGEKGTWSLRLLK